MKSPLWIIPAVALAFGLMGCPMKKPSLQPTGQNNSAPTTQSSSSNAESSSTPPPLSSGIPYGSPVPGKPGYVISPHAPDQGYVDLRGFPSGTEVKCPYTSKIFRAP